MARLSPSAWRLPAPSRPLATTILVRGNHCEYDGGCSAVLATSDLDIDALDPARKAAAAAAFARMCHTLESSMQLLVRVRPLPEPQPPSAPKRHADLDAAMHRHWTEQIHNGKRHTRQVFVAVREPTAGALDSACARATDRLSALGITATRLDGDALHSAVADDFGGNSAARWHEEVQYVAVGDDLIRGHAMRRLPGHPVDAG
jgi:hypothetical protein